MEEEVIRLLNAARAEAGLAPLDPDERLMQAAVSHAAYMAETGRLSHIGREGSRFDERIRIAGYSPTTAAENVAAGATDPSDAVQLWMESPPHRANILNPVFRHVGIGIAEAAGGTRYWSLSLAAPVTGAEPS
ncbi:CAP domain-containing protein [Sneathiella sp.]|uniref:CAP domain-containing protein n=1 Tax=Sneathiella sp. TaxID=1964365 RepID=UPI002FE059EA